MSTPAKKWPTTKESATQILLGLTLMCFAIASLLYRTEIPFILTIGMAFATTGFNVAMNIFRESDTQQPATESTSIPDEKAKEWIRAAIRSHSKRFTLDELHEALHILDLTVPKTEKGGVS